MAQKQAQREPQSMERITVPVLGLSCGGGGALALERALRRVTGVQIVRVNPATEMAYVVYDPALCSVAGLEEAIRHAGFRTGPPIPR